MRSLVPGLLLAALAGPALAKLPALSEDAKAKAAGYVPFTTGGPNGTGGEFNAGGPFGANKMVYNDEMVVAELGQVTQGSLDGPLRVEAVEAVEVESEIKEE